MQSRFSGSSNGRVENGGNTTITQCRSIMNVTAPDWGNPNVDLTCLTGNDLFPLNDRLSRIGECLVLNGTYLIPKSCGLLELKVARCGVHPILKLLDDLGSILGRYRRM